jgi:hypothetical protein
MCGAEQLISGCQLVSRGFKQLLDIVNGVHKTELMFSGLTSIIYSMYTAGGSS